MKIRAIFLTLLLVLTMACSGSNKLTNSALNGAYEFVVTSNVTGGVTLVEANLSPNPNGSQSSASGPSQVQILTLEKKLWYVNGVCPGSTPGQNALGTNVLGSNFAASFNEGGYNFGGTGTITGSSIAGNYSVTGSTCPDLANEVQLGYPAGTDQGGFVGNPVPALAGTFSGTLNLPSGVDNAALTLTENADSSLTVSAQLIGPVDNGTFPLSGSAVGNVMFVSGSVSGQNLSLFGYFDKVGAYTGIPNSLLVFDYGTLSQTGLLLAQ